MYRMLRTRLLLVVLGSAAACGGSPTTNTPPPPPPAPLANDLSIVSGAASKGSAAFDPNPKTASLGSASSVSVRWVNTYFSGSSYNDSGTSAVTHHIVADDGSFDTGSLGGNATSTKTLTAGTYSYHCVIHPTMVGTITVNP